MRRAREPVVSELARFLSMKVNKEIPRSRSGEDIYMFVNQASTKIDVLWTKQTRNIKMPHSKKLSVSLIGFDMAVLFLRLQLVRLF
jgi:hypothetical protein